MATLPISTYVTEGLARIYGFKVLRHGTDLPSYFAILKSGGIPSKSVTAKGFFHVFKDSGFFSLGARLGARSHAFYKGTFLPQNFCIRNKIHNSVVIFMMIAVSTVANTFFCPTIRFIYKENEIKTDFENDPDYVEAAYRTSKTVSNDRIGLIGLWNHALFADAKSVWQENKVQTIAGVAQLIFGLYLTRMGVGIWL